MTNRTDVQDFESAVKAICASQRILRPGPSVYGIVGNERFKIQGVTRGNPGPDTVRVDTDDRVRFIHAITPDQRDQLRIWDPEDFKRYSGFYVPFTWFDAFEVDEVDESAT